MNGQDLRKARVRLGLSIKELALTLALSESDEGAVRAGARRLREMERGTRQVGKDIAARVETLLNQVAR